MDTNNNLGRGLDSLIPSPDNEDIKRAGLIKEEQLVEEEESQIKLPPVSDLQYVSANKITRNPYQPRLEFKHEQLEQLAESIKKFGILAPLLVVRKDDGYQLIAGERRWQAAILIGLEKVPIIIREATDLEMLEISLLENLQREDLNPIEEATAFQRLMQEFNLTQEQVADRVDKNRSTIANSLRLLNLAPVIQEGIKAGTINRSQAKIILSVADPKYQLKVFKKIVKNSLTVRQTDRAVLRYKEPSPPEPLDLELSSDEEQLRNFLDTKVKIEQKGEAGKILIDYFSKEELKRILSKMIGLE